MCALVKLTSLNFFIHQDSKLRLLTALSLSKLIPFQLTSSHACRQFTVLKPKNRRMTWALRSTTNDGRFNSNNGSGGRTRLFKAIQAIQFKIITQLNKFRKNLPVKMFSFLVGFYCATAFATLIGQTGDWDVLSAAVAVFVVEGIGALMYKASYPLVDKTRSLVIVFNYWKVGISLGLFLDSFKY